MISSDVVVADSWAPPPLVERENPAALLMAPLVEMGANADVEYEHDMRKRADRAHCDRFMFLYHCQLIYVRDLW